MNTKQELWKETKEKEKDAKIREEEAEASLISPKARATALQAVKLDPLQPALLVRLSTCYVNERNFVKAYESLRKAVALLPHEERQSYKARLQRLQEQSSEIRRNVYRPDPFTILPLEIIIAIMKYGLKEDRDFVLICSWVNTTWNRTLVHGCPELWGTLTFSSMDTAEEAKRAAWLRRSGNRIHSIVFSERSDHEVEKIDESYAAYFKQAKFAHIDVDDNAAIRALFENFKRVFRAVEHFVVDGGYKRGSLSERSPIGMLDCNLLDPDDVIGTLRTMKVSNIDFCGINDDPDDWDEDDYNVYEYDSTEKKRDYSALKSLTVSGCQFETANDEVQQNLDLDFDFDPDSGLVTARHGDRYKRCPLHNMLKGARGLQSLSVIFQTGLDDMYEYEPQLKSSISSRILLENMRDLTIPPPSVMFLDILAPNVERLSFVLPMTGHDGRKYEERFRLIPLIEDSPITIETLANLTHLEFETGVTDTTSRLETWLSRAPNLISLSIRGNRSEFSEERSRVRAGAERPVSECILELLLNHPEWLPKLTELSLTHCRLPDDQLR